VIVHLFVSARLSLTISIWESGALVIVLCLVLGLWFDGTIVRYLRIAAATPLYAACPSCLYDLSKHEGQRCPECAHPCTREQAQALWQFELQRKRRELIVSRWLIPKPTPPSQTPPPSPPPGQQP